MKAQKDIPFLAHLSRRFHRLLRERRKTANLCVFLKSGVAVGSSIGHAIGGMFGGGSSSAAQPEQSADAYAQPVDNGLYKTQNQTASSGYGAAQDQPCAADAMTFNKCMNENRGDLTICGWYLDQLKACQQAARPY